MNEITPSQIYSAVEIRYNTTILGIYEYPRVLNIAQPIRNYCNAFIRGAVINNYYLVRIAFLLQYGVQSFFNERRLIEINEDNRQRTLQESLLGPQQRAIL